MQSEHVCQCILCGEFREITTVAFFDEKGCMVGCIFACPDHYLQLANGRVVMNNVLALEDNDEED